MITQVCPYCDSVMKVGYQYNYTNPVQWIPSNERQPWLRGSVARGGVKTGDGNWFAGYTAKAYYCENCRVIITPIITKDK